MEDLEKLKGDHKLPFTTLIKRTMRYLKKEAKRLILALILIVVNVILDIISPVFTSKITNELVNVSINIKFIITLVVASLLITIFNQIFLYIETMLLQHAGQTIIYNLRMEVFEHIENMSQDQLTEMPVGSLVTRVASYTSQMSDLFTNTLINILRNSLTVIGVYVMMAWMSLKLSSILSIFIAILLIASLIFSKIITSLFRKEKGLLSDLNTFLNENLSGMKLIQVFNQQKNKDEEFNVKNNAIRNVVLNIIRCFSIYRPFVSLCYVICIAVVFYFGIKMHLNAGEIMAFYLYLSRFFNPIQNLSDQLNNLTKALSSSERLFNLLDVKPNVIDKPTDIEVDHFKGKIEFKNVWFAYSGDNWILKDVSFVVNPGETCAFVGATGAGKTTILSLIVRNYEIQKGQILIDDIDISTIKVKSLRKAIGQMLQDVMLFSGSIKTNITLHDDSFSDKEVEDACEYVCADYFIKKLDHGIHEEIIERGENLSQGQRQLLSFARTILHKPQILILDEATANIDTETEVVIQESLNKIKNIGTMLVVAHRLSTIQHSDQIIVLQNGEIIEKGNHQELLAKKGHYFKLYQLQFEDN